MNRYGICLALLFASAGCPPTPAQNVDDSLAPPADSPAGSTTEPAPTAEPGPATATEPATTTPPAGAAADPIPLTHEAAFAKAKPIFDKYCESCHSKDGVSSSAEALDHFDMTTYPFGGHHAHEVAKTVRKSLGIGGKATMPLGDPGAIKGDELELVLAWADAFEKATAASGHGSPNKKH